MLTRSLVRCLTSILSVLFLPLSGLADITGTMTLSNGSSINLDAGATPGCTADIQFTGSQIAPSGAAMLYAVPGQGGSDAYAGLALSALQNEPYQTVAVTASANTVFAVKTNAGDYAKVLITAASANSVTLQYMTYGATAGAPVILKAVNNYSYGEVAPGSLFTIFGCGLATPDSQAILQDSTKGLPQTLNGASVNVTAGSVTTHAPIYYATANQIAAVLPSATPTGPATVTVTYNTTTSSAAAIDVSPAAFGFDSADESGSGTGVATDLNYRLITSTNSAASGQVITFWGSGLGADPEDSDSTYTATPHGISVPQFPLEVLIGGIPAKVMYQGSSGFPGLDQLNVQIPETVPTGCAVSVVAENGNYQAISNSVTLPIAASGGICTDPLMGISASQAAVWSGKTAVSAGIMAVEQVNGPFADGVAMVDFFGMDGTSFSSWAMKQDGYTSTAVSLGSCVGGATINDQWLPLTSAAVAVDAGSVTFDGPGGSRQMPFQTQSGSYELVLGSKDGLSSPMTGGTYTFAGGQGAYVFNASLNFPIAEVFQNLTGNQSPITISRSGQTITWTGGSSSQYITISGVAGNASFVCNAPAAAATFTIPPAVLAPLTGSGSLTVRVAAFPQTVTVPGLDAAYVMGYATPLSSVSVTYQ